MRDIAPIASIIRQPQFVAVHPSVHATTVAELIAYAKAQPNKLSFASPGVGTAPHLAGELFKMMSGIKMIHGGAERCIVRTGAALITAAARELVSDGKLRALAVTSSKRSESAPGIPAVAEFLLGFESSVGLASALPKTLPWRR